MRKKIEIWLKKRRLLKSFNSLIFTQNDLFDLCRLIELNGIEDKSVEYSYENNTYTIKKTMEQGAMIIEYSLYNHDFLFKDSNMKITVYSNYAFRDESRTWTNTVHLNYLNKFSPESYIDNKSNIRDLIELDALKILKIEAKDIVLNAKRWY